ncbi:MAG TPA: hypothetical protein DIU42_01085 [Dermacoccus sp.]|nr:hypothetical protein [Dermacoccus sp.]
MAPPRSGGRRRQPNRLARERQERRHPRRRPARRRGPPCRHPARPRRPHPQDDARAAWASAGWWTPARRTRDASLRHAAVPSRRRRRHRR